MRLPPATRQGISHTLASHDVTAGRWIEAKLSEVFFGRPYMLVTVDEPLLITCDEPVLLVVNGDRDHVEHLPSCGMTARQRSRAAKKPHRRRRHADTIHVYPTRPGAAQADEVWLPLTPTTLLVLGPHGAQGPLRLRLTGGEAAALTDEINTRLIGQAYDWVAAHPAHPTFRSMPLPAPGPILQVCDGGTALSRGLDQAPVPRRPSLLGRGWTSTAA